MSESPPPAPDRLALVLRAVIALAFLGAGAAKLFGSDAPRESFAHFGYPEWLALVVGACELAGALALWWRPLALLAALALSALMVGAVASHVLHDPPLRAAPAAILLALLVVLIGRERAARQAG